MCHLDKTHSHLCIYISSSTIQESWMVNSTPWMVIVDVPVSIDLSVRGLTVQGSQADIIAQYPASTVVRPVPTC